jgi:hypothetical protein
MKMRDALTRPLDLRPEFRCLSPPRRLRSALISPDSLASSNHNSIGPPTVDTKNSLILGVCLIVAGIGLALILSWGPASPPAGQDPPLGRFQIAGSPGHAFVLDTATGQVWEKFEGEGGGNNDQGFTEPKPRNK